MRRHWITTFLAYLCFVTAGALVYSLCLLALKPGAANNAPLYTAIWRILGLFPSAASISWAVRLVAQSIAPAAVRSNIYSGVLDGLTIAFSVVLGLAILRRSAWARWAVVTLCILTAALEILSLFQLVSYSPGLLAVLEANYRGASSGYVSGGGPGAILAALAISITLLRLLLRDGLPAAATDASGISSPRGNLHASPNQAKLQLANKSVLAGTVAALVFEILFLLKMASSGGSGAGASILLLCIMMVPHAFILIRSWHGPDRLSLGLATGYGLLISYMGAIFLPVFLVAWMWIWGGANHNGDWAFLLLEVVPFIQFFVLANAIVATRLLPPVRAKSPGLGLWGLAFLIPVVVGTAGPQFYFDWQRGGLRVPGLKSSGDEIRDLQNRETAARDLVRAYGKCAFLYAKSHAASGFPENSMEMGPGGTGCLTKVEAAGAPEGYSFHYAAAKSEGSAVFDRFTAAVQLNTQHHFNGALMDEKGIAFLSVSNVEQPHMVTADQVAWDSAGMYKRPWNTTAWLLPRIQTCSTLLRNQSPSSEFPPTLVAILSVKEKPSDPDCLKLFGRTPDPVLLADANSNRVEDHGYILDYEPVRDASGKISHFYVMLRPKRYAEDGFRSYFMDDSGVIHATPEDRAAASADPEAMSCEFALGAVCEDASTQQ